MAMIYSYKDVDGDLIGIFDADIPGRGLGINIHTSPNGCSIPDRDIPELMTALSVYYNERASRGV